MSGIAFAAAFFIIFTVSERENLRKHALTARQMKDHFQLEHQDTVSRESVAIRPGGVMVTMRDAANPLALKWTLARTSTEERDVVVISVRMMGVGGPEYLSAEQQSFSEHEQMVFTKAVSVAESFGKKVSLLVVPAGDVFAALVQSANSLEVDSVVSGISSSHDRRGSGVPHGAGLGGAARTEAPVQFLCRGARRRGQGLLHRPARAGAEPGRRAACAPAVAEYAPRSLGSDLHHSDIITYALTRLAGQYAREKVEILRDLRNYRAAASQTSPRLGDPGSTSDGGITPSPRAIKQTRDQ